MKRLLITLIFCFLSQSFGQTLYAQQIYLTPSQALKLLFKDSKEVIVEKKTLDLASKTQLQKKNKIKIHNNSYKFYIAKTDGKIDGYALIDNEVGKVAPITFITQISPQGKIEQVEIMVYRESHGGEVVQKRFLKQFHKKDIGTLPQIYVNVRNISGATLSSRALVMGTRRSLVLWNHFYGKQ